MRIALDVHSWLGSVVHSLQGVCHRDLKLENVLLDRPTPLSASLSLDRLLAASPRIKLCDFGMSKARAFFALTKWLLVCPGPDISALAAAPASSSATLA